MSKRERKLKTFRENRDSGNTWNWLNIKYPFAPCLTVSSIFWFVFWFVACVFQIIFFAFCFIFSFLFMLVCWLCSVSQSVFASGFLALLSASAESRLMISSFCCSPSGCSHLRPNHFQVSRFLVLSNNGVQKRQMGREIWEEKSHQRSEKNGKRFRAFSHFLSKEEKAKKQSVYSKTSVIWTLYYWACSFIWTRVLGQMSPYSFLYGYMNFVWERSVVWTVNSVFWTRWVSNIEFCEVIWSARNDYHMLAEELWSWVLPTSGQTDLLHKIMTKKTRFYSWKMNTTLQWWDALCH